jgi:NAD(P)-dependent dehydrogenase (short-subunit alcohol dehydrogenase family)
MNSLVYASVVLVACVAMFLRIQQPQLYWQEDILPMAQEKMGHISETPLDGVIVVLTGSTSGIGLALTRALVKLGASVVALGRSQSKLTQLEHDVKNVEPILMDLNDLESVSSAADVIRARFHHVDILINNAGIHYGWTTSGDPETAQGYDQAFGVNYLSHVLLTEKMIPLLKNSTRPTLIQTSSSLHWAVDGSDLAVPENGELPIAARPGAFSFWGNHVLFWRRDQRAYSNSKLAQILHTRALQRQYPDMQMMNVCPGWVGTQLAGKRGTINHWILNTFSFDASGWGIASMLYALLGTSQGDYYVSSTFPTLFHYLTPLLKQRWTSGLRDVLFQLITFAMVIGQTVSAKVLVTTSSPESYNVTLQDSLYNWSKRAVAEFLES